MPFSVSEIPAEVEFPRPVTDDRLEVSLIVALVVPVIEISVPGVKSEAIFWKVGVLAPAEVRIWLVDPALVKLYAEPVP